MKTTLRVCKWILVSLLIQVLLLTFIEFLYLPGRNSAVSVSRYNESEAAGESGEIRLPDNIADIKVSYDGSYIAFIRNKKLTIINRQGKTYKTIGYDNYSLSCYKWLPDRNVVIYSLSGKKSNTGSIELKTYNPELGTTFDYPTVDGLPAESGITDIELSAITNVVYTKAKIDAANFCVYRFDITDDVVNIMAAGVNTIVAETNYSDNLVYQKEFGNVSIREGNRGGEKVLKLKEKAVLLSIDEEDNVYLGVLNNEGMITAVLYGRLNTDSMESWKSIALKSPAAVEDMMITHKGRIYREFKDRNILFDIVNNKNIHYTGELVQVSDKYLASVSGRYLNLISLNGWK